MIKQILKRYGWLLLLLASPITQAQILDDLVVKEGIYYKINSDLPFTGSVEGRVQGAITDGKKNGAWIYYYENGQIEAKGNYKNSKKQGEWIFNFENGKIQSKVTLIDGIVDGEWIFYYKNGKISHINIYKDGIRQ